MGTNLLLKFGGGIQKKEEKGMNGRKGREWKG